ncbi:STAS domain-containing protein [Planctomycetaceae bacterium SH139]
MLTQERQGTVNVLRPSGPLRDDLLAATTAAADQKLAAGWPAIVVDLSQSILLSGAALEWLSELDQQCADAGGALCVAAANDLCADALRITGVGDSLQLFADLSTAVARFAS